MKRLYPWLILIIICWPLLAFSRPNLPLTHDGQDHVARVANFYQSLAEGNLIPRWAGNLNWGYGHPILMFLYPFPSYLASLLHFWGFSFVDSTKIVFGLSFILSGLFMYLWVREIWGRWSGLMAMLIYLYAPYRFVDLYVRGAIGECWAFVWPPLILYWALKFSKTTKFKYLFGVSLGIGGMILSHNALSLMFTAIVGIYFFYLVLVSRKKSLFVFYFSVSLLLGLGLSAFFWLPALIEGKYTLRDIVTHGNISGFETITRLFWSPWSYGGSNSFSVQLGIMQWLGMIVSPLVIGNFYKKKDKAWIFLLGLSLIFIISVFMMLPISRVLYLKIPLLQKFQFAWRFLSLAIFPPAVFGGAVVFLLKKKSLAVLITILFLILFNKNYFKAKGYLNLPESFYTGLYPGTTDTGESAPRWSVRFMESFPKAKLEIVEGQCAYTQGRRLSNYHQYSLNCPKESRLVENTLYFPGWTVLLDGQIIDIEFQNPKYRGLMTFTVSQGEHQLEIIFGETKLRKGANLISALALLSLIAGIIILK